MNNRVVYLDSLKGLLCVVVFLFHYISTFNSLTGINIVDKTLLEGGTLHIFVDGVFAVKLFLIISAYSVARSITFGTDLSKLITKRYFRLAIPVGITLIIVFFFQRFYFIEGVIKYTNQEWLNSFLPHYSILLFLKNLFFSIVCGYNDFLGVAWMLKYIFFGTFIVLLLKIGTNDKSAHSKLILIAMFFIISYALDPLYSLFPVGVFFETFEKKINSINKSNVISLLFVILGFLFYFINRLGFFSIMSAVFFMASVIMNVNFQKLLSTKSLEKLGEFSFSLYLVHCPLIFSFTAYFFLNFGGNSLVLFLLTCLVLLFISFIYHQIFEKRISLFLENKIVKYLNS